MKLRHLILILAVLLIASPAWSEQVTEKNWSCTFSVDETAKRIKADNTGKLEVRNGDIYLFGMVAEDSHLFWNYCEYGNRFGRTAAGGTFTATSLPHQLTAQGSSCSSSSSRTGRTISSRTATRSRSLQAS